MAKWKDKKKLVNKSEKDLLNEIQKINHQIKCTEIWFQHEKDSDMINSCIYQRDALNTKHRNLLQQAKEQNLIVPPFNINNDFK